MPRKAETARLHRGTSLVSALVTVEIGYLGDNKSNRELQGESHSQMLLSDLREASQGADACQHVIRQQTGQPIQRCLQILLVPSQINESHHLHDHCRIIDAL